MQPKEVKAFKNRLRYYSYLTQEIKSLEDEIEELYERLGGVRGIDPSKEPLHTVPNKELEYKIRDIISKLDRDLSRKKGEKEEIDRILEKMETSLRTAVISVYVDGKTIAGVASKMYLSHTGLMKRMNMEIKKALD